MRYTLTSRRNIVSRLITDSVAILINAPVYGGLTPNLSQLNALDNITMTDIVNYEIGGDYKRFIYTGLTVVNETIGNQVFAETTALATFDTALVNATHICYVYGALVAGASSLNHNNRGNIQGTPLIVKPLADSPISQVPPAVLSYTFTIKLGSA